MATAKRIRLTLSDIGVFHVDGISQESAVKASELLQLNHDQFHIYFNKIGLHNHLAHHMLTLFASGASPDGLQKLYDQNTGYQRRRGPSDSKVVDDMHDPTGFKKYVADGEKYADFLAFFEKEIDEKGWQVVLNEYLFKAGEEADDLLVRMFEGYLHPIIHLGFGVEFAQPAVIAEALAQAAVHTNPLQNYLLSSETAAQASISPSKSLISLINDIHADEALQNAATWEDREKLVDGVLTRAEKDLIKYGSEWKVSESDLKRKTAEMINAAFVFTFGAQRPPKRIKLDFYFIHCTNASIFFSSFLEQEWLSAPDKIRLLEWKGRADLAIYASRGCPKILLEELTNYVPRYATWKEDGWNKIFYRSMIYVDSHASKLIRAMAHAEHVCRLYDDDDAFVIKTTDWLRLANMAMDSIEEEEGVEDWIRSCGFDEAWAPFPDRRV
ncbi:hypothetical protein G7Z17_g11224 [Cylindrodendrum hubeiense]|uniref:HypA-like protein n=1 Tax=Cylindrodendrum hubeiense TaxID=595255 RepID=A0A9P5LBJ1_9HYPO|nr:hypothetical protein G7Z17_g11224 [Cylindrodendrum hubeiense]